MKIKVLVVDGSAVVRLLLAEIINSAPGMQVIAMASDESQARQAIKEKKPDVMTLDVAQAGAKGMEFLAEIARERAISILVVSEAGTRSSQPVLRAMELGAVDFIARPGVVHSANKQAIAEGIRESVRRAHQFRARPPQVANVRASFAPSVAPGGGEEATPSMGLSSAVLNDKVILIGASTGGTEAVREVLAPLPAQMPPILIVQHMPELFTASFAKRLDSLSRVTVKEAEDGEPLKPGTAYLAPGHSHLSLRKASNGLVCELSDGPPVNRHRPSVDVLFLSAAKVLGPRALALLLTGMGKDGAQGLLALRQAGAWTAAQDEDSCVVWGMPREAVLIGGAQEVASLKKMPELLLQRLRQCERRAA